MRIINYMAFSWVRLLFFAVIFFGLGWSTNFIDKENEGTIHQIRTSPDGYQFIQPLLFIDNSEFKFTELNPLKDDVVKYIDQMYKEGTVSDVGFYFRDLDNGKWTGVNEDQKFAPASMLKVVTLIMYLKLAQKDSTIILNKTEYTPLADISAQAYKPSNIFSAGKRTNRELLQQMIIESDNAAMNALDSGHIEDKLSVYKDLGLPNPLEEPYDFLSPLQYSRILRTLYNSGYLTYNYSEQALNLLSYTKFDQGIKAGVGTTTVAHKFGERTIFNNRNIPQRELHDCGIVYYPSKHYLICIMTKGRDFSALEKVIAHISKIVFDYNVSLTD